MCAGAPSQFSPCGGALCMQATASKLMYQLQAFPTNSVLKDFIPYRGIILSSEVILSPDEYRAMRELKLSSLENSSLIENKPLATVLIDTGPVLELIAKEWKYDLALLKEGKGDTGIEDHSWTMYSNNKISPVIVRWDLGKARIHLVMGNEETEFKFVAMGNIEAKDILERLTVILSALHEMEEYLEEIEIGSGDTLQKVQIGKSLGMSDFMYRCVIVKPDHGKLSDARRKDCIQLANSCDIDILTLASAKQVGLELKENEMLLNVKDIPRSFKYTADVGCSWEICNLVYNRSIRDAGRLMNRLVGRAMFPEKSAKFEAERKRSRYEVTTEIVDPEIAERQRFLTDTCKDVLNYVEKDHSLANSSTLKWRKLTLANDFRRPEPSVLKGTSPHKMMREGEVCMSSDLINLMIGTLFELEKHVPKSKAKKPESNKPRIRGRVDGINKPEEKKEFEVKLETISNPYFSLHMGMPVRVDQSVSVWREADSEALACDIWYDMESRHLHVANMYRIKAPTA